MLSQVDVILSDFVVISAFLALISSKLLLQYQPCGLPVTSIDITTRLCMNLVLFPAKALASRFHVYGLWTLLLLPGSACPRFSVPLFAVIEQLFRGSSVCRPADPRKLGYRQAGLHHLYWSSPPILVFTTCTGLHHLGWSSPPRLVFTT